jgi:hypothetical protein
MIQTFVGSILGLWLGIGCTWLLAINHSPDVGSLFLTMTFVGIIAAGAITGAVIGSAGSKRSRKPNGAMAIAEGTS